MQKKCKIIKPITFPDDIENLRYHAKNETEDLTYQIAHSAGILLDRLRMISNNLASKDFMLEDACSELEEGIKKIRESIKIKSSKDDI